MADSLSIPAAALPFAIATAKMAGRIQLKFFRKKLKVRLKESRNPVTMVDTKCEKLIVDRIKQRFPKHGYLAEEKSQKSGNPLWVIDPLDGTTNYARGLPCFCVSIALVYDGVPHLGVIHDPLTRQTFHASRGKGAFLNNERIHVSETRGLKQSLITVGFPYRMKKDSRKAVSLFNQLLHATFALRRAGSAALDIANAAAGFTDGHIEQGLNPWDVAAGIVMVEEAGGKVTVPHNNLMKTCKGHIICGNRNTHDKLLKFL